MVEYMLTTIDNPYNPFTQYDAWYAFDLMNGYDSCGLLARVTATSDELSDPDQALAIDEAIDEIIEYDPFGIYIKVTRDNFKPPKLDAVA